MCGLSKNTECRVRPFSIRTADSLAHGALKVSMASTNFHNSFYLLLLVELVTLRLKTTKPKNY